MLALFFVVFFLQSTIKLRLYNCTGTGGGGGGGGGSVVVATGPQVRLHTAQLVGSPVGVRQWRRGRSHMDERHSCALGKQLIETDKCVLIILQICEHVDVS